MTTAETELTQHHSKLPFGFSSLESKYALQRSIGKGSYGKVIKALQKSNGKTVAIKHLENIFHDIMDSKRIFRELYILKRISHPSIVKLMDVQCNDDLLQQYEYTNRSKSSSNLLHTSSSATIPRHSLKGDLFLVFEFVDTDLLKILRSNQFLSNEHIQYILYQLIHAVHYLHQQHIIHRDIKPANILVSCSNSSIKLADFGLSRSLAPESIPSSTINETNGANSGANAAEASTNNDENNNEFQPIMLTRKLTKHVVTRWYRAPEIILLQQYSYQVDNWSIGCVFADLLNLIKENCGNFHERKPLFPGESCSELSIDEEETPFQSLTGKTDNLSELSNSSDSIVGANNLEAQKMKKKRNQLQHIVDVIGPLTEQDISYLDEKGLKKMKKISKFNTQQKLEELYPAAGTEGIALLKSLLTFNPNDRLSLPKALKHPYFNNIRRKGYISMYQGILDQHFDEIPEETKTLWTFDNKQSSSSSSVEEEGKSASLFRYPNISKSNGLNHLEEISENSRILNDHVMKEILSYR